MVCMMKIVKTIFKKKRQLRLIVELLIRKILPKVKRLFSAKFAGVMTKLLKIRCLTLANAMDR